MENLIVPGDAVEQLFGLQGEDALLGQLEHQIKTLPEREKLISVLEMKSVTEDLVFVNQAESVELRKNEKRLELELSSIETRLKEVDEKLYSGVITTEKEAKSLQDEIGHNPSPKAALALVQQVVDFLDIPLGATDLQIAAASYDRQINELVESDPNLAEYAQQLLDEATDELTDMADNPQAMIDEVEKFLRQQDE